MFVRRVEMAVKVDGRIRWRAKKTKRKTDLDERTELKQTRGSSI